MMFGRTCSTCNAFQAISKECRAKTPTAAVVSAGGGQITVLGVFPATKPENWCREWKSAEEQQG
jgi:hypothetical protein